MLNEVEFVTALFAMWIEQDVTARRAAIEAHFHNDVHLHDRDGDFVGYQGLETFSDSLRSRFPGAEFTLAGRPQLLGDAIRAIGTSDHRPSQTRCPGWTSSSSLTTRCAACTPSSIRPPRRHTSSPRTSGPAELRTLAPPDIGANSALYNTGGVTGFDPSATDKIR
jgi:hypothetical protein